MFNLIFNIITYVIRKTTKLSKTKTHYRSLDLVVIMSYCDTETYFHLLNTFNNEVSRSKRIPFREIISRYKQ